MRRSFLEMQAHLNDILRFQQRDSTFLLDAGTTTFAGSINSRKAFKELDSKLYQNGVRGDTVKRKETQVLEIFQREGGQPQTANDDISRTPDTTVEAAGGNIITALPTFADSTLSKNTIQFCIFGLFLGTLLAGTWITSFPVGSFIRIP